MQQLAPCTSIDARRRCPGLCSTSYVIPRSFARATARPWRTVAKASSSVFDLMDRQFAEAERQFDSMQLQMERDIDAALSRAREAQRQADVEVQRATRGSQRSLFSQEMRPAPNVDIQRQEEWGPGVYRYYERIQIGGNSRSAHIAQAPVASSGIAPVAPSFNPAFVGVLVVLGGYVTLTAAFNRNYALTNYAESKRWMLLALWPLLFLFSAKFREQFGAAIRGERVGLRREEQAGGSSSDL